MGGKSCGQREAADRNHPRLVLEPVEAAGRAGSCARMCSAPSPLPRSPGLGALAHNTGELGCTSSVPRLASEQALSISECNVQGSSAVITIKDAVCRLGWD